MEPLALFTNKALMAALIAWSIAQLVKPALNYLRFGSWDWALLLRAGGMPSSHSALVAGLAHALAMFEGYSSPHFAIALVLAMIVIYDATGIRRQAGIHAQIINQMIHDLASGHPLKQETLREVLGHTPMEAVAGTLLGVIVAQIAYWLW
jgi:uncharacterized protein